MMLLPQSVVDSLALPEEASTVSRDIDALHLVVISATLLGSLAVGLIALWFVVKYRRRGETPRATPPVVASPAREWLSGAAILSLFIAFWWVGYRQYLNLRTPPENAMSIYVTAKQWTWKFTYDEGDSANDVVTVPIGRPIKLIMTSRDVIHSFYVPAFRLKQDVIPGRYVTLWFQATRLGDYDIFCAEYCGLSHSQMHGLVRVVSPEIYARLRSSAERDQSGSDDLIARGMRVAEKRECVACHAMDGQSHLGPTWVHLYDSQVTMNDGRKIYANDEYLTRSMMEPNADVVAGYQPIMPSYLGTLDPAETAALVAYIRSLRDGAPPSGVQLPKFVPVEPEKGRAP